MNLSRIEFYALKGFSPAVCGIIEKMYSKIQLPVFSRFLIQEKTNRMVEEYQSEMRNMSLDCIFRDHLKRIIMIGESQLDEKFPDSATETYKMECYPVAVLNLKVKKAVKTLYITYSDFKFYLMKADETAAIEEIQIHDDLKSKLFTGIDFRKERAPDGSTNIEPIEIQILATTGWNKNPLSAFKDISPFDVMSHNNNVIYTSQEQEDLYRLTDPFLMYATPIMIREEKVVKCPYIMKDIHTLLTNKNDSYETVSMIKVQNFYPEALKGSIIPYIIDVLKKIILVTIESVNGIPIGTVYKDEEDLSELYRACIRFICLHHELKVRNVYNLPWNSTISETHKELIVKDLTDLYQQLN